MSHNIELNSFKITIRTIVESCYNHQVFALNLVLQVKIKKKCDQPSSRYMYGVVFVPTSSTRLACMNHETMAF